MQHWHPMPGSSKIVLWFQKRLWAKGPHPACSVKGLPILSRLRSVPLKCHGYPISPPQSADNSYLLDVFFSARLGCQWPAFVRDCQQYCSPVPQITHRFAQRTPYRCYLTAASQRFCRPVRQLFTCGLKAQGPRGSVTEYTVLR